MSLRKKIIHTASWTTGGHIISQLIRLASNLVMTRLLVPEMFGVMAVANIIMTGLALISDMGIKQHIIQNKKGSSEEFLNTAWVVQIIRGIVIWCCALIVSLGFVILSSKNFWPVGTVYTDAQLPYIISILSFVAIIGGFESTKIATAYRDMMLKQVIKIEFTSQAIGIIIMIAWAYINRTVWALVIGTIISSLIKTLLSHYALPGKSNKVYIDQESLYELLHFGKWIFLSSTLGFAVINGDRLVLGGIIDARTLGIYTIAVFMIGSFQQFFSKISGTVVLPAISETVRTDPHKLKDVYYRVRQSMDGVALIAAGLLFVSGHNVIDILYDNRYKEAGEILEILSLLLVAERYSVTSQCFIALGKPKYMIPMIVARLPIIFILVPIIYHNYGLLASVWVIALNRSAEWPMMFYYKIKLSIFSLNKEVYFLIYFAIGSLLGWVINKLLELVNT